jgi:2-isopropylmalate synthase
MRIVGGEFVLHDYRIRAVTRGKDAQGEVRVELGPKYEEAPDRAAGRGLSTDILEASTLAYVNAVNRLMNPNRRRTVTQHTGV